MDPGPPENESDVLIEDSPLCFYNIKCIYVESDVLENQGRLLFTISVSEIQKELKEL